MRKLANENAKGWIDIQTSLECKNFVIVDLVIEKLPFIANTKGILF